MALSDNPLLDFSDLPHFDAIRPEHIGPAIDALLSDARAAIAAAEKVAEPSWDNFIVPLDNASERLGRAWNQVNYLQAVVNTPELREAYNGNLPKLSQFSTEMGQNLALFAQYKKIANSSQYAELDAAQKKTIDNALRDFRLSGAELDEDGKLRFAAISEELASLGAKYEQNVLDANDAFVHYVRDEADLAGVPDDVKATCRAAAVAAGEEGFKLTLHMPCYLPVMQYCENRALREMMYHAYVTRASEFGPSERDNTGLIERIVALRAELAGLLGFASYGDYSLATKMADSPAQVLDFLRDMGRRAKPFAQRDRAELEQFGREQLGIAALSSWDVAFVSEKLKEARYSFSEQEVKAHFTEPKVLAGLFGVIEKLFGMRAEADVAPLWHPDARFYRLVNRDGQLVGQFYLDLYARPNKRGGAWMDDCRNRRRLPGGHQTPLVYLTCNFGRGSEGRPATFSHDEVITLFHEFGHGLHQLLTEVGELAVAGINGVEWDAVELPSQFMENFCWEWDVVAGMTAHVDTGATLPRPLFDRMLAAKNYLSGMQTVRQLEFGLFDMELHSRFKPGVDEVRPLLERVRDEVAVNRPPAYDRLPCAFTHVFAGGYAAGYFSYKWAEVLSADAYGAFEERGGLDAETGERFRREILAVGGSRPALESFRAFRGRDPSIDALLRHSGMVAEPA